MFTHETQIRVRYGETDQMGYAYYGNYAQYFEVARVEALRSMGIHYKKMEESGIALPVLEFKIKYFKPAYYDDMLTIELTINQLPKARIHFEYKTFNEKKEQLNVGETTLVFVDMKSGKPMPAPDYVMDKLLPYFSIEI